MIINRHGIVLFVRKDSQELMLDRFERFFMYVILGGPNYRTIIKTRTYICICIIKYFEGFRISEVLSLSVEEPKCSKYFLTDAFKMYIKF